MKMVLEIKNYTILYIMSIHAIAVRCINATSVNVWETKSDLIFDRCINYITVGNKLFLPDSMFLIAKSTIWKKIS